MIAGFNSKLGNTVILLSLLTRFALTPQAQVRVAPSQRPNTATHRPAEDPLREVEDLLQKGQLAEAEQKLQPLMDAQAKNPQAWFDLGFIQSHLGKTQDAIASYKKAVELQPDWFEANLNLGVDLKKNGDASEAVSVLKRAVELKPASGNQQALARAWLVLGQALETGDPLAAAKAYDRAAELNPADIGSIARAGGLLEHAGDLAKAEDHYIRAAKAGDTGAVAHLIDLLNRQKRFADSETWLRKYIQQRPQDYAAIALLGHVLLLEGKTKDAISLLEPASRPARAPISTELAAAYIDDKQYAAAIPLLQDLARQSADPDIHMRLGYALLRDLKYADAESELLKAVQLKPDLPEAYGYLADAARQSKHYELCIRVLDARTKFLPETPGTYFLRATAYDELHMIKPAVANYKQFLSVAEGKYPDQEFQARHRLKALEH